MADPIDPLAGLLQPLEIPNGRLFHFALAVPDLQRAMALLGPGLNVDWTAIRPGEIVLENEAGRTSTAMQAVYSRQGPPFIELVTGPAGTFFSSVEGPRLHHAGVIVDDVRVEVERLQALGMVVAGWGAGDPPGVAYVTNELGLALEIMGPGIRETIDDWFSWPSEGR